MADIAQQVSAPTSRRSCTTAGYPDPQGAARTHHRSRDEDREGARDARAERGLQARARRSGPRRSSSRRRRASTGPRCSTPRSSASAQKFDAYHSAAIPKLAALVGSEPLQNWKDWLAFHTLNQHAERAAQAVPRRELRFLRHRSCQGTPQQRPRDALALNATSNALQDAVGKAYVDKYFPASSKAADPGHGRQPQGGVRPARAGDRLDDARRPSRRR